MTRKRKFTDDKQAPADTGQLTSYNSAENVLVNIQAFQQRLKQSIEDDQAVITADIIRQSLSVDKLDIQGQFEVEEDCLDEPMRPLAESLQNPDCKLTSLKISYENIGAYRIMLLAKALTVNHSLTYLHIAHNPKIGRAGAHYIAEFLKTNRTLTMLNIRRAQIGTAGVTDIGKALEQNSTLLELELAQNDICFRGAKNLANSLKKNQRLHWLSIEENSDMGAKGAHYFAELLKITTTLTFLNLSSTQARDAGAKAIADAICANHNLPHFHLGFQINRITDNGIYDLVRAIKTGRLIALDLGANENLTSVAMRMLKEALQNSQNFRYINVGGGLLKKYKESDIQALQSISTQKGITFQREEDDSAGSIPPALMSDQPKLNNDALITLADSLKGNTTLTYLQICLNRQCDQSFKNLIFRLKQRVSLTTLSIKLCKNIHIQMLAELLAVNSKITALEILGYKPSVVDFTALGKVLKTKSTLSTLKLSDRMPFAIPHGGLIKLLNALGFDADPGALLPGLHLECTSQSIPAKGDAKQILLQHPFYPITQLAISWNMLDSGHLQRFLAHNHQLAVLRLYNCSSQAVINDVYSWLTLNNTRLQHLEYSLATTPEVIEKYDFIINQERWNFYNASLVEKLTKLMPLPKLVAEVVRNYLSWECVFYSAVTLHMPADNRCLFWSVGLGLLLTIQAKFPPEKLGVAISNLLAIQPAEVKQITQIATLLFQYRHGAPDFQKKFLQYTNIYQLFLPMVANLQKQMVYFIEQNFSLEEQAKVYIGADCANMQQYKTKVFENLWGGDAEISTLASMLKINIFVSSRGRKPRNYQSKEAKFTLKLQHVSLQKSASCTPNHYNLTLPALRA